MITDFLDHIPSSPLSPSPKMSLTSPSPLWFEGQVSNSQDSDATTVGSVTDAETEAAMALCFMSSSPPSAGAGPNEETWMTKIRAPGPPVLYKTKHVVDRAQYVTAYDPRGYLPVYEYNMETGNQVIMIDVETSYVRFTGIWKAMGHAKADLGRLQEETPELAPYIRKIRGGFLKIQGTWLPFDVAKELSRRVAYRVRNDLVPIFGPDWPATCLRPGEAGYGCLLLSCKKKTSRRRSKRAALSTSSSSSSSLTTDASRLVRPLFERCKSAAGCGRVSVYSLPGSYPSMFSLSHGVDVDRPSERQRRSDDERTTSRDDHADASLRLRPMLPLLPPTPPYRSSPPDYFSSWEGATAAAYHNDWQLAFPQKQRL